MQKEYICDCGKIYNNPQSFNGHKSHCKTHLTNTGRLHIRENVDNTNGIKTRSTFKQKADIRKQTELDIWISEKHVCEKCGKLMTIKYATGRFCSQSCANSKPQSAETRAKIGSKLSGRVNGKRITDEQRSKLELSKIRKYNQAPNHCCICNSVLPYNHRLRQTCSKECTSKLIGIKTRASAARLGGNNNVSGVRGTAHYGTYKGFHCDSSYELAVVIYCLEHNINIVRNTQGFDYTFNNEVSKYYPDFIINNVYVETKNYWTEQVQAKIDQFPKDLKYAILYYDDIKLCIDYCIEKYGNNFTKLYDRTHPSWMDRNMDKVSS